MVGVPARRLDQTVVRRRNDLRSPRPPVYGVDERRREERPSNGRGHERRPEMSGEDVDTKGKQGPGGLVVAVVCLFFGLVW